MAGGKLSPRQRMINMMYLVLMALLALNVSKEILKSFHDMSVSFEQSRAKLESKLDRQIAGLEKSASNDPSLIGYLQRTKEADALIDQFIADIEQMEKDISTRVDEEEGVEKGAPSYMYDVEGSDNMEKHAFYFVKDDDEGKQKKGFRGEAFRKKINDTRAALVALMKTDTTLGVEVPQETIDAIESSSALRAYDGKINKKTWAEAKLEHAPLGAVVALLAQIKNDARTTQSAVTDVLAKGKESVIAVSGFVPIIKTKTSAVMIGQEYEAEIYLGAQTKSTGNVDFKLNKGGSALEVNGDRATYKVKPSSQGTVEWGGVIYVKSKTGTDSIPFNAEYQVFQGQASIAATKMNVLYIGVDNPISIAVPGVEPGNVKASMSGGSLVRSGKNYVAKVTQTGKATIRVSAMVDGNLRSMGQQEYKVRKLPTPIAKWGTVGSGLPTPKQALLAQSSIRASMGQGFAFDGINYRVTSYQFIYAPKRGEAKMVKGNGSAISGSMKGILQRARRGDRILVDKIRATGPGGTRTLLPLMIEIR